MDSYELLNIFTNERKIKTILNQGLDCI